MAEGGQPNINFNVFVRDQHVTTNIEGSNIESLAVGRDNNESNQTTPRAMPAPAYSQQILGDENPEDVTWLSQKVVLFNKRRISRQQNSKIFHGRQTFAEGCVRDVAIKMIPYNEKSMRELQHLAKLNHPNIVQIYDAGEYKGGGHWTYIVMELCSKNLEAYIKDNPPGPKQATLFFKQMVAALNFMHHHNIAHRDIKPNNILVSQCGNYIKFSDFGISKEIPEGLSSVTDTSFGAGTEGYMAPEMFERGYKVSLRSDIFSLGLVTAILFTGGKHPFGADPRDWSYNIRKCINFNVTVPRGLEIDKREQLLNLLQRMLQQNPLERPTINEIASDVYLSESRLPPALTINRIPSQSKQKRLISNVECAAAMSSNVLISSQELRQDLAHMDIGNLQSKIAVFDVYSGYMHFYNPVTNEKTKEQKFNDVMQENTFQAVAVGQRIYVLMDTLDTMYSLLYKEKEATWTKSAKSPRTFNADMTAVAHSGKIFLLGNGQEQTSEKSVMMYEPVHDMWHIKPTDGKKSTMDSAIVATNDYIYCFGGTLKDVTTNSVDRLDLKSYRWSQLAPMKNRVSHASAVEWKGKIFLMGGFGRDTISNSLGMFDPYTSQWLQLADMKHSEHFILGNQSCYAIQGYIYILNNMHGTPEVERYNIDEDRWESEIELPEMHISASCLIG